MTNTPVLGASPVTFISEKTQAGRQYQVPLSALSFDTTGSIHASVTAWITSNSIDTAVDGPMLTTLVDNMVKQGLLFPPPPT